MNITQARFKKLVRDGWTPPKETKKKDKEPMFVKQIGRLTYSNCAYRHDIMFYAVAHRHLFGRFWWRV